MNNGEDENDGVSGVDRLAKGKGFLLFSISQIKLFAVCTHIFFSTFPVPRCPVSYHQERAGSKIGSKRVQNAFFLENFKILDPELMV